MKSGDQSIGWPSEINLEYLDTEYIEQALGRVDRFEFIKGGTHPCC